MKILHFLKSSTFSGAENVVCQIISICKDPNIEFIYSSPDGSIRDALKERNIKFFPLNSFSLSEFRRAIKEIKPDIIHAHDMGASVYAALTCGKIPIVSHIHNNAFSSRTLSIKSVLYLAVSNKFKKIFWVSKSAFSEYFYSRFIKYKSEVLYNIIDIQKIKEKSSSDSNIYNYDIIYLGRLTYQKNPERLVDILEKVIHHNNNIRCAIIGAGELEVKIKDLVQNKDLSNNIHFLGFLNNPYKILQESKVMLMTSRWEGTPMCSLEAMSLGVPVVCTPTDGLSDVVRNGETGYLSDIDDILVQRCLRIVTDESLHSRLSHNSVKRAETLMDKDSYREKILSEYNRILSDL